MGASHAALEKKEETHGRKKQEKKMLKKFTSSTITNDQLESQQVYDFKEPVTENCICCGCEVSNWQKMCEDCKYDMGRE